MGFFYSNVSHCTDYCLLSSNAFPRLLLYLIYFPPHLKFANVPQQPANSEDTLLPASRSNVKSDEWRLAITLAWVVAIHMYVNFAPSPELTPHLTTFNSAFETFVTLFLLTYHSSPQQIQAWATVLGVTSAALAIIQYLPQLIKTYRMKLVGAISIPMMCIQSPGSVLMVVSIAVR